MELIAFVVLTALAITSAIVVISHKSPVISAVALAFNLVSIAGFYLLLQAQFIAMLQVIVYAGAIMVLILFVIMLLNLEDEARRMGPGVIQRVLGPALALAFAVLLGWAVSSSVSHSRFASPSEGYGTVSELGHDLFTRFFYPFEAISLLLVVAMIGAVLLAKRRL